MASDKTWSETDKLPERHVEHFVVKNKDHSSAAPGFIPSVHPLSPSVHPSDHPSIHGHHDSVTSHHQHLKHKVLIVPSQYGTGEWNSVE